MVLGFHSIHQALQSGHLRVSKDGGATDLPIHEMAVTCASIDLRLGNRWLVPKPNAGYDYPAVDPLRPMEYDVEEGGTLCIPPQGFRLAVTEEWLQLSKELAGFVEGRSSVGRSGLFIHNAGWVDPGFRGTITLELFNASPWPMYLTPGTRICQIVLVPCAGAIPYVGKYQGQVAPTGCKLHLDADS